MHIVTQREAKKSIIKGYILPVSGFIHLIAPVTFRQPPQTAPVSLRAEAFSTKKSRNQQFCKARGQFLLRFFAYMGRKTVILQLKLKNLSETEHERQTLHI